MIAALFFFLVSLLCGLALVKQIRLDLSPSLTLVVSMVIGTAAVTLMLFFIAWVVPMTGLSVVVELGVMLLVALWSIGRSRTDTSYRTFIKDILYSLFSLSWREKLLGLFFILLAVWLFGRSLFFDKNDWLVAGDRLVWTDWPLHAAMASNFAWGQNIPPQNPTFAGIPLIYPFFADFLSGALLLLGATLPVAFAVPGVVLTLSFFGLFVVVASHLISTDTLLKSPKSLVGMGALFLSLFWGGLGWVYWLQEAFSSEVTLVETLLTPPREYTFWGEKGLWFFTFLYSEILPQRAFLFGLPLFFLVLILVITGWQRQKWRHITIAGVIAGLLPFFHTHTYLSMLFLSVTAAGIGGLNLIRRDKTDRSSRKKYLKACFLFFVPFVILSVVQLPLFLSQSQGLPFEFGWMKKSENFFLFWFKNTGFFIPLYLLGLWKGKFGGFGKLVGVSAWILFILPNLFRFAAWGYDNLKILTYWYLIGSVFVVAALAWLWNLSRIRLISRIGVILLLISLTLSGVVEVARLLPTHQKQIGLWSPQDQEFARELRQKTPPDAVFLTAAVHDHPVTALAGRKILLGFPGNSWSWGIEGWSERERDIHTMFRRGEEAKSLWKKYGIDYIVVGDKELWFEKELDEGFIAQNNELVMEWYTTKVYKVK